MGKRKNYFRKITGHIFNRKIGVILTVFVFLSCGREKSGITTQDTASVLTQQVKPQSDTRPRDTLSYSSKEDNLELKWNFTIIDEGEYGEPITEVSITVNNSRHKIENERFAFFVIPESELKSMELKGALTACRGWWAGQGAEYWALKKNNDIFIMKRFIGEEMGNQSSKIKTEKIKVIPIGK